MDAHKNFAISTVATAPSPASSGPSLVVAAGHGARFPAAPFNATVWPAASNPTPDNAEIVRVTAISTDTLTIVRAQESASARAIVVGDQIAATITVKTITDIEAAAGGSQTPWASDIDGGNFSLYNVAAILANSDISTPGAGTFGNGFTVGSNAINPDNTGSLAGGNLSYDASGNLKANSVLDKNSVKILDVQQSAIADSDGSQADDTRAINALLAAARAHGLIAT